ncbi:hypothetical protein FHG87_013539 [Trinorchestia longiramus]|nr:hypothetical protein FHG87_013539 [Trinorchestia longiramus]
MHLLRALILDNASLLLGAPLHSILMAEIIRVLRNTVVDYERMNKVAVVGEINVQELTAAESALHCRFIRTNLKQHYSISSKAGSSGYGSTAVTTGSSRTMSSNYYAGSGNSSSYIAGASTYSSSHYGGSGASGSSATTGQSYSNVAQSGGSSSAISYAASQSRTSLSEQLVKSLIYTKPPEKPFYPPSRRYQ